MESRVTSVASFSALQPSVPAGRIGRRMKRVSAVESHTRMRVSSGNLSALTAFDASASSARLKTGSLQALATTRAPLCGPILVS
jgi:hypothetical protein